MRVPLPRSFLEFVGTLAVILLALSIGLTGIHELTRGYYLSGAVSILAAASIPMSLLVVVPQVERRQAANLRELGELLAEINTLAEEVGGQIEQERKGTTAFPGPERGKPDA